MDWTTSWQGCILIGTLKGEMGIKDHAAMSKALDELAATEASGIVLNFADVVYLASVGIGMLMKLVKDLHARGTSVRLAGARPAVKMVLEMVRADSVLPMDATVAESVQRFLTPATQLALGS